MKKLKEQKQGILEIASKRLFLKCQAGIFALFFTPHSGYSNSAYVKSVDCLGAKSSRSLIFLHGLDTPARPDAANQSAYEVLKKISSQLNIRLALPRSNTYCKQGRKLCWNVSNKVGDLKKIYQEIKVKSSACFPHNSKPILVAFSNGGYFLNKLVHHCILPRDTTAISIGSAGYVSSKDSLASCARLNLMLGKYESTYKAGVNYFLKMKSLKARIKLTKFNGGHMVPYEPLYKIISEQIKTSLN
ncbi:MAG: hypothetical protein HRU09_20035 [Oligoflexales bacterium]|nr:hypothetical protein [Oligoflexales bacterium]